jgi:hypothetical protein
LIAAAEETVAPVDVKALAAILPVNVIPLVRPSAMLSTEMAPLPARPPAVIIRAPLPVEFRVPFTVMVVVPAMVCGPVSVTVIPRGMITTSDDSKLPGNRPPHVSEELKLPDKTAV